MSTGNPFADMLATMYPKAPETVPRPTHGVNVNELAHGYARLVLSAVIAGWLDGNFIDGNLYVQANDLFELAGSGADPEDAEGGCHVPAVAKVPIPYRD